MIENSTVPLPPPKNYAERLEEKSLEFIETWYKKYGNNNQMVNYNDLVFVI